MAGRPTKFRKEYCDLLVQHMADGASVVSFAAEIDVARSTINQWAADYPEFAEALERGKAKACAWWEKVGRQVASTGTGNAPMAIFGMCNMGDGDWRNKQDVGVSGNVTVEIVRLAS